MILADTSVWIEHLRTRTGVLSELLNARQLLIHPFVVGELALGNMRDPNRVLEMMSHIRPAPVADHHEVLTFIRAHGLAGAGIGYVDSHLLASVQLSVTTSLWTFDKRLEAVAVRLGLGFQRH